MAKKRRSRRYYRRIKRYVKSQKMPLETAITMLGITMTPAKTGWGSPIENVIAQNWGGLGQNLSSGFVGVGIGETPDLLAILNPMDLNHARYTKMLILSGLISRVRKRFVKLNLGKIPLVGGMIS